MPAELPFRMVVSDIANKQELGGKVGASGKVETGVVAIGDALLLLPEGLTATVKDIQVPFLVVSLFPCTNAVPSCDFRVWIVLCVPWRTPPLLSRVRHLPPKFAERCSRPLSSVC
jgi:hypothetical protein